VLTARRPHQNLHVIPASQDVPVSWILDNAGETAITVERASSSCGCLRVVLTASFDFNRSRRSEERTYLYAVRARAGGRTTDRPLAVTQAADTAALVEPALAYLGTIAPGASVRVLFHIRPRDEETNIVSCRKAPEDPHDLKFNVEEVDLKEHREVIVAFNAPSETGAFRLAVPLMVELGSAGGRSSCELMLRGAGTVAEPREREPK